MLRLKSTPVKLRHNGQVLRLTSLDRAHYLQTLEVLRPFGRPLNLAIAEYAEIMQQLLPGVSLREVVTDYTRCNQSIREPVGLAVPWPTPALTITAAKRQSIILWGATRRRRTT